MNQKDKWLKLIRERPEIYEALEAILQVEDQQTDEPIIGWREDSPTGKSWDKNEVPMISPNTINLMVRRGLLHKWGSNKYKVYCVLDPDGAREALELMEDRCAGVVDGDAVERVPYEVPTIPPEMFDVIEGHDDIKEMFYWSIEGEKPTHILLEGPPASCKSVFLEELERFMPRAVHAEGYRSSKSGISDQLLNERPFFYLIDEIGEMHAKHLAVLRGLCGRGRVTETLHGRNRDVYLPTRVYAAGNRLPPDPQGAIGSRFEILEVQKYLPGEFVDVAMAVLTKREGVADDLAQYIVDKIKWLTVDVRDAERVARLCPSIERVDHYMEIKRKRGGW